MGKVKVVEDRQLLKILRGPFLNTLNHLNLAFTFTARIQNENSQSHAYLQSVSKVKWYHPFLKITRELDFWKCDSKLDCKIPGFQRGHTSLGKGIFLVGAKIFRSFFL